MSISQDALWVHSHQNGNVIHSTVIIHTQMFVSTPIFSNRPEPSGKNTKHHQPLNRNPFWPSWGKLKGGGFAQNKKGTHSINHARLTFSKSYLFVSAVAGNLVTLLLLLLWMTKSGAGGKATDGSVAVTSSNVKVNWQNGFCRNALLNTHRGKLGTHAHTHTQTHTHTHTHAHAVLLEVFAGGIRFGGSKTLQRCKERHVALAICSLKADGMCVSMSTYYIPCL